MLNYSPLCDVSYSAYIAYLAANISDRSRHGVFVSFFGGESGREYDSSCIDAGGNVNTLDSGGSDDIENHEVAGVRYIGDKGCNDGHDNSGLDNAFDGITGVEGGAGVLFCDSDPVAVGASGDSVLQQPEVAEVLIAKADDREVEPIILDSTVDVSILPKSAGRWAVSNRRKKERRRAAKASVDGSGGCGSGGKDAGGYGRVDLENVTTVDERRELARLWFDRKRAENRLAIQRAEYNAKRNIYLDKARISEKRWEQERLTCEQKLANITAARFGSKPGYAETIASMSDGSELPPSLSTGTDSPANLSDGTISPNSSMSVAEENRMRKKIEELSEKVTQMELEKKAYVASHTFSGGKAVIEDGRICVYDGTGQYVPPTPSIRSLPACYSDYFDDCGNYIGD